MKCYVCGPLKCRHGRNPIPRPSHHYSYSQIPINTERAETYRMEGGFHMPPRAFTTAEAERVVPMRVQKYGNPWGWTMGVSGEWEVVTREERSRE